MDDGLSANYHMQGPRSDGGTADKFTHWKHAENKVNYVKTLNGHPWDIFLYDQYFIYHWITEAQDWSNAWHFKKNNNGLSQPDSDRSFPWLARCAVPGQSSFWVKGSQGHGEKYNTRIEIHDDSSNNYNNQNCAETNVTFLGAALLELKPTGTDTIIDKRETTQQYPNGYPNAVTTLPLQYTYNCAAYQNASTCGDREIFAFAVDTVKNHKDNVKHSYGWIRWKHYHDQSQQSNFQDPPDDYAYTTNLVPNPPGSYQIDFPCGQ
ncbi:MAG: hypothetical protein DMG93_00665 [Acidobacteria bacterium]|nr:MAG: hypothetical protein DMG93_00665 [Acidobacteriota bacterium]